MSLDFLRLQVSSGLVVAARHWRRICHTALTGYGISEACAAPLLMFVRLGDGVHQVAVAQAAPWPKPLKPNWCACAAMCSAVSIRPTWKLPCVCFVPSRLPAWAAQAGWHERFLQLCPSGP